MLKLHTTLKKAFPDTFQQLECKYTSIAEHGLIMHNDGTISFKLQEGAIKEVGENGVQTVEMLHFIVTYLRVLDNNSGCKFNDATIKHLLIAIAQQNARTTDREQRGVEGTSAP